MYLNCFRPVGLIIIPVFVFLFTKIGSCSPVRKIQNIVRSDVNDYDISHLNKDDDAKSTEEQNSNNNLYGAFTGLRVLTGKSQEWTNFQHSRPIKRSDDPLNNTSFPCPSLPEGLGALNTSNPMSKYHCPINLLYGNNLTVKNFFLMVPKSNESSNNSLYQLQSMDQGDTDLKTLQQSKPEKTGSDNEVGSLLPNLPSDNSNYSTQPPPSNTNQDTESSTLALSTVASGIGPELLSDKLNITTDLADSSLPTQNLSSENSLNSSALNETSSSEEVAYSLPNDSIILAETSLNAASETSAAPSIDTSVSSTIASTEVAGNSTSCSSSAGSENSTTLNMSNEILRTLDKYCETYVATSTSTSTFPTAQIDRQAHFYPVLDDNNKVLKIAAHVDQPKKEVNIMKHGNKV